MSKFYDFLKNSSVAFLIASLFWGGSFLSKKFHQEENCLNFIELLIEEDSSLDFFSVGLLTLGDSYLSVVGFPILICEEQ